jgi:hypothetical protein
MPDEMIASPAQNSGGVGAAAVFLSAHTLQIMASSGRILRDASIHDAPQDEVL